MTLSEAARFYVADVCGVDALKSLIFVNGPNGVGKSTACALLHRRLPCSSLLESEWCRTINPFDLTPEAESLTESNMSVLLSNYLQCSLVDHVILSYGLHGPRKRIFESVLRNLRDIEFLLLPITLVCSEEENVRRMMRDGRDTERIRRGLQTRLVYERLENPVIDTTHLTVEDTVAEILAILWAKLQKHQPVSETSPAFVGSGRSSLQRR